MALAYNKTKKNIKHNGQLCLLTERGRNEVNNKSGREDYLVSRRLDPTNYSRYLKRTNEQRLLDAYNYIYEQAFGKPMGWKVQKDFYEHEIKGI